MGLRREDTRIYCKKELNLLFGLVYTKERRLKV